MNKIKEILGTVLAWIIGIAALVVILSTIYAVLKGIYLIVTY